MLDRLIESAANRVLGMDPDAASRLGPLVGRTVDLRVSGFPDPARFYFDSHGVRVERVTADVAEVSADASLSGSPFSFARAAMSDLPANATGVEAGGDLELAQRFANLIKELDIDFEDELAQRIGGTPARQLGRLLRHGREFFADGGRRVEQGMADFLKEESGELVSRNDLNQFLDNVDDVRAQTDALQRRLELLEQKASEAPNVQ